MTTVELLENSRATAGFREALLRFLRQARPGERIAYDPILPAVKVERALAKMLEEYPALPIESIRLEGRSGCEFFRGTLHVITATEERRVAYHWDCKWRAQREGWVDWFGLPDQARAAREFGYDCFRAWSEEAVLQREEEAVPA